MEKSWLPYYAPIKDPKLRLFAFHWAGGSASAYNGLAWREFPDGVEVLAVQLPGREKRGKEETPRTAQEAARLAVKGLSRFFAEGSVPTAIFAHSMGTWVAFEFVRELRRQNLALPKILIVSNLAAPQTKEESRPWRRNAKLTDSQFKDECRAWGVKEIVMKDTFWKQFHLPFRRDFTIFDEYVYEDEDPLDVPIVCFLSQKDPRITKDLMRLWAAQSTFDADAVFELRTFTGDHFYVQEKDIVEKKIVPAISEFLVGIESGDFPHAQVDNSPE